MNSYQIKKVCPANCNKVPNTDFVGALTVKKTKKKRSHKQGTNPKSIMETTCTMKCGKTHPLNMTHLSVCPYKPLSLYLAKSGPVLLYKNTTFYH